MSPQQRLQILLADVLTYDTDEVVTLLPIAAALLSALCARATSFEQTHASPETDYLLTAEQTAQRLGKSTRWVRRNVHLLPFAMHVGQEMRFSVRLMEAWINDSSRLQ